MTDISEHLDNEPGVEPSLSENVRWAHDWLDRCEEYVRSGNFLSLFINFRRKHDEAVRNREYLTEAGDTEGLRRLNAIYGALEEARAYEKVHGIGTLARPCGLTVDQVLYLNPEIVSSADVSFGKPGLELIFELRKPHGAAHWRTLTIREQDHVVRDLPGDQVRLSILIGRNS